MFFIYIFHSSTFYNVLWGARINTEIDICTVNAVFSYLKLLYFEINIQFIMNRITEESNDV